MMPPPKEGRGGCRRRPSNLVSLLIQGQLRDLHHHHNSYSLKNHSDLMNKISLKLRLQGLKKIKEDVFRGVERGPGEQGVYGVEFMRNGKIVLSSHSDGFIRIHDARTHSHILTSSPTWSHKDCCNGTTPIDGENTFASFSDDKMVLVWDMRKLDIWTKQCQGHLGWVKNINVTPDGKTLLTSGCDESLRKFDLTSPHPMVESPPILCLNGLCRTKLHPNGRSLYLTTWRTSVLSIDNLDLDKLEEDALNYCLTGDGEISPLSPEKKRRLTNPAKPVPFTPTRNKVGIVHYLPYNGTRLTSGQSLSIHPEGECCAVRYSYAEGEEDGPTWSCVYPLRQPHPLSNEDFDFNHSNLHKWFDIHRWYSRSATSRLQLWRTLRLPEQIEEDLLRHGDLTRMRLSLLFSQWVDPSNNDSSPSSVKPQFLRDASHYTESPSFCPNFLKEINFSPCGRLLIDPIPKGFQILGFDKWLNNPYQNDRPSLSSSMQAKELVKIADFNIGGSNSNLDSSTPYSCLCAKFSPDLEQVVVGTNEGHVIWVSDITR